MSNDVSALGLEARLQTLSCGDHGCIIRSPIGMGTNGGCQHLKVRGDDRQRMREMQQAIQLYRLLVKALKDELALSRSGGSP